MIVAALLKTKLSEAVVATAVVGAWSCNSKVVIEPMPMEVLLMEGEGALVTFSDGGINTEDP